MDDMKIPCSVPGCGKYARRTSGRLWCSMHDERWRQHGSLEGMRPTIEQRFYAKVDQSQGADACHEWTGSRSPNGYGKFSIAASVSVTATRWLVEYTEGRKLTGGEKVLHKCDNPPCVNIRHLYVGDAKQNSLDMVSRNRANPWNREKTHCKHNHPFSTENTYIRPNGSRACRTCLKVRRKKHLEAKK